MNKRQQIVDAIASNPRWCKGKLVNDSGEHCALGQALSVVGGLSDDELICLELSDDPKFNGTITKTLGLRLNTADNLMTINDYSPDFATSVRAVRAYLLGKSYIRALKIIGLNPQS
jgi:hypothetical protein